MNMNDARTNMVKQQLRTAGVLDESVLRLFAEIPREDFVPTNLRKLAFTDAHLDLGYGQVMFSPQEEGLILQELAIQPDDHILEVGTGSGFFTALLAEGRHVTSVEVIPELHALAQKKLGNYPNVTLEFGNAAAGWQKQAPYDVIVITGSLASLPEKFFTQCRHGGKIFAILGKEPVMRATVFTQRQGDAWTEKGLFEILIPPLLHASQGGHFEF